MRLLVACLTADLVERPKRPLNQSAIAMAKPAPNEISCHSAKTWHGNIMQAIQNGVAGASPVIVVEGRVGEEESRRVRTTKTERLKPAGPVSTNAALATPKFVEKGAAA